MRFALLVFAAFACFAVAESLPVNCFDYYEFGSVRFDFKTDLPEYSAGDAVTVQGKVFNNASSPVSEGAVLAQVLYNANGDVAREGLHLVDEFFVARDVNLRPGESKDFFFKYSIPEGAPSGEYSVALFFVVADRWNLAGLSFASHVYGGLASFRVAGSEEAALFNRSSLLVNGKPAAFRSFSSVSGAGPNFSIELLVRDAAPVEVVKELFAWDALRKENLLSSSRERVDSAGGTASVSAAYSGLRPGAYLLRLTAVAPSGWKTFANVRFTVLGEKPRFIYSGLTAFPVKKGGGLVGLFSCFSNTVDANASGRVEVLLSVDGKVVGRLDYSGVVSPGVMGLAANVSLRQGLKNAVVESRLYDRNGNVVDEVLMEWDYSKFGYPESVLPSFSYDGSLVLSAVDEFGDFVDGKAVVSVSRGSEQVFTKNVGLAGETRVPVVLAPGGYVGELSFKGVNASAEFFVSSVATPVPSKPSGEGVIDLASDNLQVLVFVVFLVLVAIAVMLWKRRASNG